jgi:hypothetical protein
MGGQGSGRKIEIEPGSDSAARLLDKHTGTLDELADRLDCSSESLRMYLKGDRYVPLQVAILANHYYRVPIGGWVKRKG